MSSFHFETGKPFWNLCEYPVLSRLLLGQDLCDSAELVVEWSNMEESCGGIGYGEAELSPIFISTSPLLEYTHLAYFSISKSLGRCSLF